MNYLEQHYQIQKAGAHFLSINDIRFTVGESYENFYMELHGAFEDTLRKRGETLIYKNNEVLDEDEEMSPTLENTIVMMSVAPGLSPGADVGRPVCPLGSGPPLPPSLTLSEGGGRFAFSPITSHHSHCRSPVRGCSSLGTLPVLW
jgi:hypothetical protein